jgi:hypothetical protein
MRLPWGWAVAVGILVLVVGSVALFRIPTLEELGRRWAPKEPLSQDELHRLGALQAVDEYCNDYVERTPKVDALERRLSFNPEQKDALVKAKESFKDADCGRLIFQFPDMYRWVNL